MKQEARRNDPCPCGSGKKYKKCCGNPKLSARTITVLKEGPLELQQKISSLSKEGITATTTSLAGRVAGVSNVMQQKKD